MTFLSPLTILAAAAITVPPLVALYFLKLKRSVRLVPTTLLWRKAVEDLQVNAPFQRLRRSLLLLLQLMVLALAAIALGKPMLHQAAAYETTALILIDQSASMAVVEADGRSRLDAAKALAKQTVDGLGPEARAMVIMFCDRARVVSSFDADKEAVKRKIDSIDQTQSTSSLSEAVRLAEAFAQNLVIGGEKAGADVAPESAAPPASVFLFTDGRIEDADKVVVEKLDVSRMVVSNVGHRADNLGILTMSASRNYDQPGFLEATALVRNFGPEPATVDVVLYVDGRNVDVRSLALEGTPKGESGSLPGVAADVAPLNVQLAVFDQILFEGGGLVEVMLRVDDALKADDRAWVVIDPPSRARVLLVSDGNMFLDGLLPNFSV